MADPVSGPESGGKHNDPLNDIVTIEHAAADVVRDNSTAR